MRVCVKWDCKLCPFTSVSHPAYFDLMLALPVFRMVACRVGLIVSPNTHRTMVISGTVFYGSNDPTNSVKALKQDVVLRIRL